MKSVNCLEYLINFFFVLYINKNVWCSEAKLNKMNAGCIKESRIVFIFVMKDFIKTD